MTVAKEFQQDERDAACVEDSDNQHEQAEMKQLKEQIISIQEER